MKKQILIVGSGFSGMWAAVSAARLSALEGKDNLKIAVAGHLFLSCAFAHASMKKRYQRWSRR